MVASSFDCRCWLLPPLRTAHARNRGLLSAWLHIRLSATVRWEVKIKNREEAPVGGSLCKDRRGSDRLQYWLDKKDSLSKVSIDFGRFSGPLGWKVRTIKPLH